MITIQQDLCTGCGACVRECLSKSLHLVEGKARYKGACILCGHCFALCPEGAIRMPHLPDGQPDMQAPNDALAPVHPESLLELMRRRRSIRAFRSEPVRREDLEAILEAGRLSPTAGNRQPLRFIVLEETLADFRKRAAVMLGDLAKQDPRGFYTPTMRAIAQAAEREEDRLFFSAPQVVLVLREKDANENDAGIAIGRMELLAAALGIGVCLVGFFPRAVEADATLQADLGIGENERLMLAMALGYSNLTFQRHAPRKPADITWR